MISMNVIIKAMGKSMGYLIQEQDLVIYSNQLTDIDKGDIIIYKDKHDLLVCHRYFFSFFNYIISAGDNCIHFEIIHRDSVLGKLQLIIKHGSKYDLNLKTEIKRRYCKLIVRIILLSSFMSVFKINYMKSSIYNKMINKRNKEQIRYLKACHVCSA